MRIEQSIAIDAPPEAIWSVMMAVEAWPEWTESMSSVSHIDAPPLRVGSQIRIKQPRLPAAEWIVTEIAPLVSFTWRSRNFALTSEAVHRVEVVGEHGSRVTLTLEWHGPLGWLVGLIFGRIAKRYLALEAEGLKRRCEQAAD